MANCNIPSSKFYKEYCNKRQCSLHPCSQMISAHRVRLGDVAVVRIRRDKE